MHNYVGKWVIALRSPSAQNRYIGKFQCIFILEQTEKMVYGVENIERAHWNYKYHISEIVQIVNSPKDREKALNLQMHTKNNYRNDLECLQRAYSIAIEEIALGKRKHQFNFTNESTTPTEPKSFEQQRCPLDDELGAISKIEIVGYPLTGTPNAIKTTWLCQKCFSTFETSVPYLEIKNMG